MTGETPTQPLAQVTRQGAIAVLTIDRSPVNALSQAVGPGRPMYRNAHPRGGLAK